MSMSKAWLERYADAWSKQIIAGGDPDGPVMQEVLSAYNPDARYLDVPSGAAWVGREAIGQMVIISYDFSNDYEIEIRRMFTDGKFFAGGRGDRVEPHPDRGLRAASHRPVRQHRILRRRRSRARAS
jgi:hypothetical protein